MRPRPMTQIMAQASQLDALDISRGQSELWLRVLDMFGHQASQISDALRRMSIVTAEMN